MAKVIRIMGNDPSFSNWGIAEAAYNVHTGRLEVYGLDVIKPVVSKDKGTRQSSIDLERAKQLSKGIIPKIRIIDLFVAEVPHGSQSARAMAGYGVCIGILSLIHNTSTPFIEVSAIETRKVITGTREASKAQAIAWARAKHPEAPWPMHGGEVNASRAEHMADAIAAIYAAMETNTFKTMAMLAKQE